MHANYNILRKKRFILIVSAIPIILIIGVASLFKFGGYYIVNECERETFIHEIKYSPQLPERFYEIYNKIYPRSLEINSWKYLVNHELRIVKDAKCPCREAVYYGWYPYYYGMDINMIISTIEDNVTQKQCLNYYANKSDFHSGFTGLHDASECYFNKKIVDLNDNEFIELIVRMENAIFYNKKPELLAIRINQILTELNK